MSQLKITNAGVTYKDEVFAGQEVQNITHFVFANIPDQLVDDEIDVTQSIPSDHVVHTQPIERVSRLNDNAVVMSAILGYDTGDFTYNWFGAVATKADGANVLIAIVQTEKQVKTKTKGATTGNYSVKSIVWRTSAIAQSLNIALSVLPWQTESGAFVTHEHFRQEMENHVHDDRYASLSEFDAVKNAKLDRNFGNVLIKPLAVPHGSLTVDGINGGYAGIHFSAVNHTLMMHDVVQGSYNHNANGWDWSFTRGELSNGTVPLSRVTGTQNVAFLGGINTWGAANNFAHSLMVKGNHVYHAGNKQNSLDNHTASYDKAGKSIHMDGKGVDYVRQLHFNNNVRLLAGDGDDRYLDFKYGDTIYGGIRFFDGNGNRKGYLYSENNSFGLLSGAGGWGVKVESDSVSLHASAQKRLTVTAGHTESHANIEFDNYGLGTVGKYSPTRFQQVFAMGNEYKLPTDGSSPAVFYGVAWTHSNNPNPHAQQISGHHMVVMSAGKTRSAIGDHIWTYGNVTAEKKVIAKGGLDLTEAFNYRGNNILNGVDTWLRTYGDQGVFFASYGGGWHMSDATWIRSFGGKKVHIANTEYDALNVGGGVQSRRFTRHTAHTGHLEGSYNNVGGNGLNTNPIYTIGSSYNPDSTNLSTMYGIGYTTSSASFLPWVTGAAGWGMYVAAAGVATIFLDANAGKIWAQGDIGGFQTSDRRLKDELKPVTVDIEQHMKITPMHYRKLVRGYAASEDGATPAVEDSYVYETGLFAQQMQELGFHNFVHENEQGDLTLKQGGNELHAYHIAVTQKLNEKINTQAFAIEQLTKRLEALEGAS